MPAELFDAAEGTFDDGLKWRAGRARYAKDQVAFTYETRSPFKNRAARLACALRARYSNREHAYIMSQAKFAKLVKLLEAGADASFFTGQISYPSSSPAN